MTTQVEEQAMTQSTSHARAGSGMPGSRSAAPSGSDAAVPTWDEVVELHSARVYRLAYRLTGNRQDAEDLTQEVFVRVFRSLSSYTPGTFEGWLHRITTNLFLDGARRKAKIRFDALCRRRRRPHPEPHRHPRRRRARGPLRRRRGERAQGAAAGLPRRGGAV
jgi:DNA-directed RNA polymerase specialized sigma24 family protein